MMTKRIALFVAIPLVSILTFSILNGCNEVASNETPKPEYPSFQWNLHQKDWGTTDVYKEQLLIMLKYVDEELYKIRHGRWSYGNIRYNTDEYMRYIELRLTIINLLHNHKVVMLQ